MKMESLGTLAGGIAHDFNNLLGIILGYANIIPFFSKSPEKLNESVDSIKQATQRGAQLIRQLLTFAKKTEIDLKPVHINDILDETCRLLTGTFPENIDINLEPEMDLPLILCDLTQIQQILINLCVNARDAVPSGGKITISTTLKKGAMVRNKFPEAIAEQYVLLQVQDNGSGMSEEIKDKIFEPFYTTKGPGKGTGLGLSLVYSIVTNHRGFIDVISHPGKGTEFRLYFPVPDEESIYGEETEITGKENKGNETILIIEDEKMLRTLLINQLQDIGYKVLEAGVGEQGLEVYYKHRDEIDLVLLDLGLPKTEGAELVDKILEDNENVSIIIASGYIGPEVRAGLSKKGVNRFVQKPFELNTIVSEIRSALDSAGTGK